MDAALRQAIVTAWHELPAGCRYPPATEEQLLKFEVEFGAIPPDYRWFLAACGGGTCGREWVDGIAELVETHRKFRAESRPGGWRMRNVFVIGWDGFGNPFAIDSISGRLLAEDHNFGGIHEMAKSFPAFLCDALKIPNR
jgi:SMI1/KNR4 family protein SUKH-1